MESTIAQAWIGMRSFACAIGAAALLGLFGAALVAGGCSNGNCTEIGCDSGVSVSLVNKVDPVAGAAHVRACSEGQCEKVGLGRRAGGAFLSVEEPSEREVELEVTVVGRTGQTLARDTQTATLEKTQPNGPDCEPTCYGADGYSYDVRNLEWDVE